jgi:hypothetical protein
MAAAAGMSPIQKHIPKLATLTICIVPPPSANEVWEQITRARTQLKDPGLFRWPPHVNLLYPFIECCNNDQNEETTTAVDPSILRRLEHAVKRVRTFHCHFEPIWHIRGNKAGSFVALPE